MSLPLKSNAKPMRDNCFYLIAVFYLFIISGLCYSAGVPGRVPSAAGADLASGQKLYETFCAVCHGDQGDASSWARNGLQPPPRDFTRTLLSRQRMLEAVLTGRPGTAMMPYGKRLSVHQVEQVVDFIRQRFMDHTSSAQAAHTEVTPPGKMTKANAHKGGRFYRDNCSTCHGLKGDGQGPRAHFMHPKPRNFTSYESRQTLDRQSLVRAIAQGKRGTVMPAWSTVLDSQQIADVAEYVYQTFVLAAPTGGSVKKNFKASPARASALKVPSRPKSRLGKTPLP